MKAFSKVDSTRKLSGLEALKNGQLGQILLLFKRALFGWLLFFRAFSESGQNFFNQDRVVVCPSYWVPLFVPRNKPKL